MSKRPRPTRRVSRESLERQAAILIDDGRGGFEEVASPLMTDFLSPEERAQIVAEAKAAAATHTNPERGQ
jgi:hypothetical protein